MNLITCAENCVYQQEGYCRLTGGAPVSALPKNGCSYYKPRSHAGNRSTAGESGLRREE